jgi:hypothetical protein
MQGENWDMTQIFEVEILCELHNHPLSLFRMNTYAKPPGGPPLWPTTAPALSRLPTHGVGPASSSHRDKTRRFRLPLVSILGK